jgi:hypothetical protein
MEEAGYDENNCGLSWGRRSPCDGSFEGEEEEGNEVLFC